MATNATASVTAPSSAVSGFTKETTPSSDLAMAVSRNTKDLVEVIKELDDYFLKAPDASAYVSLLLEVLSSGFSYHNKGGKVYRYGWSTKVPKRVANLAKEGFHYPSSPSLVNLSYEFEIVLYRVLQKGTGAYCTGVQLGGMVFGPNGIISSLGPLFFGAKVKLHYFE